MGNKYNTIEQKRLLSFIKDEFETVDEYVKTLNADAIINCLEVFDVTVRVGLDKKTLRGIYSLIIEDYMRIMKG